MESSADLDRRDAAGDAQDAQEEAGMPVLDVCIHCGDAQSTSSTADPLDAGGRDGSMQDASSRDADTQDASSLDAASPQDAAPEADAPLDDAAFDFGGHYEGSTSQGLPIWFELLRDGLIELEFSWDVTQCASTTHTSFAMPVAIVDDHIERYQNAGGGGVRYTWTADLVAEDDGGARATGTLDYMLVAIPAQPSCMGSRLVDWTAERVY